MAELTRAKKESSNHPFSPALNHAEGKSAVLLVTSGRRYRMLASGVYRWKREHDRGTAMVPVEVFNPLPGEILITHEGWAM